MAKRLTWRREPREKGLAGVVQGHRGWDLRYDGQTVAQVRPVTNGINAWTVRGWYSYGGSDTLGIPHRNTRQEPAQTEAEAMVECNNYVRECLQKAKDAVPDPVQSPTQD